MVRLVQEKI
jgi:adenylate kinase family enzyme